MILIYKQQDLDFTHHLKFFEWNDKMHIKHSKKDWFYSKHISCHCEGYIKHYSTWEPCFTFPDIVIRYAIFIICIIMIECWWMIWWRFMFCHITTKYFYGTKVNFMCLGSLLCLCDKNWNTMMLRPFYLYMKAIVECLKSYD